MEEIFGVGPLLGDAANANDLSDLFKPGALHISPSDNQEAVYSRALAGGCDVGSGCGPS